MHCLESCTIKYDRIYKITYEYFKSYNNTIISILFSSKNYNPKNNLVYTKLLKLTFIGLNTKVQVS